MGVLGPIMTAFAPGARRLRISSVLSFKMEVEVSTRNLCPLIELSIKAAPLPHTLKIVQYFHQRTTILEEPHERSKKPHHSDAGLGANTKRIHPETVG